MAAPTLQQVQSNLQIFQNLILVTPGRAGYKPIQSIIDGKTVQSNDPVFVFHFEGEQKQSLTADITDHPAEDNTTLQDEAALKPEVYSTQGFVGELNDILPGLLAVAQQLADKLVIVGAMAPALTVSALVALNRSVRAYNTAANTVSAVKNTFGYLTTGNVVRNKQQEAYNTFKKYWANRTLFTVQTPWSQGADILQNMILSSVVAVQDDGSESSSTFEVAFKTMAFAKTKNSLALARNEALGQLRFNNQNASTTNLGLSPGGSSSLSVASAFGQVST